MIISLWLLRRFGVAVLFVTLSLLALLSMFDLLANANSVTEEAAYPTLSLFYYWLLRAPSILVFILPFAVLIAALKTFATLASHQESVPLQTSGFSLYRIAAVFSAGALVMGFGQFHFVDRIVTSATAQLAEWEADSYRNLPKLVLTPGKQEWLSSGNYIISIEGASNDGRRLEAPTLIWRNEKGVATRYLEAEWATFVDESWTLANVSELNFLTDEISLHKSLPVAIDLLPLHFAFLNRQPEVLRTSELMILGSGTVETQLHPARHYLVAAWHRVAQPFGAVVMVLLAAPVALQLTRSGNRILFVVAALVMGFLYFVFESVLLTLGNTGELPVQVAVWGPGLLFSLVGLVSMLHQQR